MRWPYLTPARGVAGPGSYTHEAHFHDDAARLPPVPLVGGTWKTFPKRDQSHEGLTPLPSPSQVCRGRDR